jgi:hypothetical protein
VLVTDSRGPRAVDVMAWAEDPLDELGDFST